MPEMESNTRTGRTVAVTCGDPNGIGPEVALKATLDSSRMTSNRFILVGPRSVWDGAVRNLELNISLPENQSKVGPISVHSSDATYDFTPDWGSLTAEAGRVAMTAIDDAVRLCKTHKADAMVTAPISKEAVNLAGYSIPGHTEYIRDAMGASDVLMMLISTRLKVAVVTGHIPLSKVARTITTTLVEQKARLLHQSLSEDFQLDDPRIAVLGLNPHAGDGGIIGSEDATVVSAAIDNLQAAGLKVSGPHPADGFFGNQLYSDYDAVLAMYHDQGLIPFKTLSFNQGVNFTAGLSIVRTSPDHGTAFDIAGKGKANESSMRRAIDSALEIVDARQKLDRV